MQDYCHCRFAQNVSKSSHLIEVKYSLKSAVLSFTPSEIQTLFKIHSIVKKQFFELKSNSLTITSKPKISITRSSCASYANEIF